MAHITAAQRRSLPSSAFGLPEKRKYPTDTRGRAIAAKSYAKKEEEDGKLSLGEMNRIVAKANRKLKK